MQRGTKAVSIIVSREPNSREGLLVKRDYRLPFLGGYLALPAGGLEDEDRETAQLYLSTHSQESESADYSAFVAAAARELFEETGVWLAKGTALSRERLQDYRHQILSHQTRFSEVLKREDQRLESRDLTPIFRITTPQFILKYYDTWFLHCHIPAGEEVEIPGGIPNLLLELSQHRLLRHLIPFNTSGGHF